MKKLTKILLLVLTVALLASAFVVSAFAEVETVVTDGNLWEYTDDSDTTIQTAYLSTAVSGAKAGSTIRLLGDYKITTAEIIATIDKELTIDLGGYTFEVSQSSYNAKINVQTDAAVTIKNGSLIVCANENATKKSFSSYGRNYPLVYMNKDNANVVIDGVTTYVGTLIYNYSYDNVRVTVNGGTHYCHYIGMADNDADRPGYFVSRSSYVFEANDAKFLISYPGGIINAATYEAGDKASDRLSTATFTNCKIVHSKTNSADENASFIRKASSATYFYFNNCDIMGSFNPGLLSGEAYTDPQNPEQSVTAATSANFVFGSGTRWDKNEYSKIVPTLAEGLKEFRIYAKPSFTYSKAPAVTNSTEHSEGANPVKGMTFLSKDATKYPLYTALYYDENEPVAFEFEATDGLLCDAPNLSGKFTWSNLISNVKEGTTVYVKQDFAVSNHSVGKNLTIDLGGNTMTMTTADGNEKNGISVSANVTYKNGTIKRYYTKVDGKTYTLFALSAKKTLTLENITSYTGGLVYSYGADDAVVNIKGGEHHMILDGDTGWGNALIDTRTSITVKARDAKFYLGDHSLIAACSQNTESGDSTAHKFLFKNCDIITDSAETEIIKQANVYTTVTLYDCFVVGSFNPGKDTHTIDAALDPMLPGALLLGHANYFASGATFAEGLVAIADGCLDNVIEEEHPFTMNYATGSMKEGSFAAEELTKSFTFTKLAATTDDKTFTVGIDDVEYYITGDFLAALNQALTCTTSAYIDLLGDATYSVSATKSVNKEITVDLKGYTLNVVHEERETIYPFQLSSTKMFTVQNGNLNVLMSDSLAATTGSQKPFAAFGFNADGAQLTLNDLNVTSGTLIYNMTRVNPKIYINGGNYEIKYTSAGLSGGIIESRDNITVEAVGAKFYLNARPLFISMSYNSAGTSSAKSTFTYTDCDIYRTSKGEIIGGMNQYTWVTFNNCTLYGALTPAKGAHDGSSYTAPNAENIILGEGTTIIDNIASIKAVAADGYAFFSSAESHNFTIGEKNVNTYTTRYKIVPLTEALANASFVVTRGGKDLYETYTFTEALAEVQAAKVSATVKFLGDATYTIGTKVNLAYNLTLDLNSHSFEITTTEAKDIGFCIYQAGVKVAVKNGTITTKHTDGSLKTPPIFIFNKAGTYEFENVTSYTAALVYNYSSTGAVVNFIGGEHHIINAAPSSTHGGVVETRDNMTLTATGTKFYTNLEKAPFVMASVNNDESTAAKANTLTFTDCYFYNAPNADGDVAQLLIMNATTQATFNACYIHALLSPTKHPTYSSETNPENGGAIILGDKTTIFDTKASSVVKRAENTTKFYTNVPYDVIFNVYSDGVITETPLTFAAEYQVRVIGESASEGAGVVFTEGGIDAYAHPEYPFLTVLKKVSDGGTIKLLSNVTYTVNEVTSSTQNTDQYRMEKSLTVDLNGFTLDIVELGTHSTPFYLAKTGSTFTIKGGNIKVSNTSSNAKNRTLIFIGSSGSMTVNVENVNYVGGQLVCNWSTKAPVVNVTGGSFRLENCATSTDGGLIESRDNITVNVSGSDIYLTGSGAAAGVLNSMHVNAASTYTLQSTFTFTNCDIYRSNVTYRLLGVMNNFTTVRFDSCNLYGSLTPVLGSRDEAANPVAWGVEAPTAANIIIGAGTTVMDGATINATIDSGLEHFDVVTTVDVICSGTTIKSYVPHLKYDDPTTAEYSFTKGGDVLYSNDATLAQAISRADAGTTLYVLKDVTVMTPDSEQSTGAYARINKALTIDLGGNTLYFSQSDKETSYIQISTNSKVVIENGTLVWNINENYVKNEGDNVSADWSRSSYALFYITNSNKANLTINNVKGYGGALVYSYSSSGSTINVNGGEYHIFDCPDINGGGFVHFRANANINVNGTTFYLEGGHLMTLMHYCEDGEKASTATFTDCNIIGTSVDTNVMQYLNGYTTVTFNECRIRGSINPSRHEWDTSSPRPAAGSIVLGYQTLLTSGATLLENVVVPEGDWTYSETNQSINLSVFLPKGSMYDPDNNGFALEESTQLVVFTLMVGGTPVEKVTVTWYKEDGHTVIKTERVEVGTVVVPPVYTPGTDNGWYKTGFDGWARSYGSYVKITDFTVNVNTDFYPALKADSTPVAYLSGAQYNVSFTGQVILNFYLPNTPVNVTNVIVTDVNGNVIDYDGVWVPDADGQKVYYRIYEVARIKTTELNTPKVIFVDFKVDGLDLRQKVTLNPLKYTTRILEDSKASTPVWTGATHTLMADMVRYSNYLAYATTGEYVAELDALLDEYGSVCSELPSANGFGELISSTYNLNGYVTAISYDVTEYEPRWVLTLNGDKKIVDVKITLDGFYDIPDENGVNYGTLVYGIDENHTANTKSGNYYTKVYIESIPVYNVDKTITITVFMEDGTEKSANYNLNTYFHYMESEGEELYNYQLFLRAFRAFGISSSGYKYPNGKVEADVKPVDFFACDHANAIGSGFTVASGRYCSSCRTNIFFYDDYINETTWGGQILDTREAVDALSDEDKALASVFSAVDACHYYANNKKVTGYNAGCVATAGKYYYFHDAKDMSGNVDYITVSTNTSWAGANIVIDDSHIEVSDKSFSTSVFELRPSEIDVSVDAYGNTIGNGGTSVLSYFTEDIVKGQTKLPYAPGVPMMITLTDSSVKRYIRGGSNAGQSDSQTEAIIIDEYGNVDKTTPIEWTYNINSLSVYAYNLSDEPIKLSGLDKNGNISCTFENITKAGIDNSVYGSCERGILVRRANTVVEGFDRLFTEDDTNQTTRQAYRGFVHIYLAYNTVCKDMKVVQHISHRTTTDVVLGSYEISGYKSVNTSWVNYKVKNFFTTDDGRITYTGLMGTNYMRNMYMKDCFLNSFDAHKAAYNVTLEDCTFEHINLIGAGDVRMKNITVYLANQGGTGIVLRSDYGSRWDGDIHIDGLEYRWDPDIFKYEYIELIKAYQVNRDYGYGAVDEANALPTNIYVNNLSTMRYDRDANANVYVWDEDGKLHEDILEIDTSIPVRLYGSLQWDMSQLTSVTDFTKYDSVKNLNARKCTEKIIITNSTASVTVPCNHRFFDGMYVEINGVVKKGNG